MQTKVIKEKIKSVGSIKKITKTMEMVSAAKMKKAIDKAHVTRPFRNEAEHILTDILLDRNIRHPLLTHNGVETELVILVASNKGLCGSYNTNIYRKLVEVYTEDKRKHLKVITVGKYAEKMAKKLGAEVYASFNHPLISFEDAHAMTKMILAWYKQEELGKEIGTVKLIYTHYTSASSFTATAQQILPFVPHVPTENTFEPHYAYEPGEETVLTTVIPMMLHNLIYGAILESYASEHSARMFAMKSATDNAKELQDELKLYFNRARQGAVTQEIAEISTGAMALQG